MAWSTQERFQCERHQLSEGVFCFHPNAYPSARMFLHDRSRPKVASMTVSHFMDSRIEGAKSEFLLVSGEDITKTAEIAD